MGGKKKFGSDKYEDITSYSTPKGFKNKIDYFMKYKFKPFFMKNQKRNLKAILSIVICLVLVVSAAGGAYLRKMLSLINIDSGATGNPDATFALDEEDPDDNMTFNTISDIGSANSIKDLLRSWATNNGEKIYNKKVINVLLIGEDNEGGSHRSDSTMLVSVNTKTEKITITSFLRDSYSYMEINGSERFDKMNHSYAWGGAAKLMEVISNNYKVRIDYYVSIDYESFVAVIDALGGVSVPITESEASFMNRTTRVKGFSAGESVHLNGTQALVYARIRKLDSEVERTRRQRELISSVIKNVKASSLSDLDNAIETFLPYVTTNMTSTQILKYGTQALSEGWLKYDIVSMVEPAEEFRYGVDSFRTYTGNLFVWIVDYIQAARQLQLALYDQTNIDINPETHISAIALAKGSSSYNYEGEYSDVDPDYDVTVTGGEEGEDETTTEYLTDQYGNRIYFEETTETTTSRNLLGNWEGIFGRDENESTTSFIKLPWDEEETTTEYYNGYPYEEPSSSEFGEEYPFEEESSYYEENTSEYEMINEYQ